MARKKTVTEKIADVVDHVIHPHGHDQASDEKPAAAPIEKKSSDSGLDYKKHPKFDKFNSKDQGAE